MKESSSELEDEVQQRSPEEWALMKQLVETWKRAGPILELQREEEVRRRDIFGSHSFFAGMVLRNLATFPAAPTSGLFEQQAWFRKLHASR